MSLKSIFVSKSKIGKGRRAASLAFTLIMAFSMTCPQGLTQAMATENAKDAAQAEVKAESGSTQVVDEVAAADEVTITTDESVPDETATPDVTTADESASQDAIQTDEAAVPDEPAATAEPVIDDNVPVPDEPDTSPEPAAADDSISTQSTVDEDGKYSVVVDYVDAVGDKVAPSYEKVLDAGQSWSADSPMIEGYALHDSTQATVTGTASGSEHWLTYKVTYDAAAATYTVVHMKQLNGGGYYAAGTETKTGITGETVTVAAVKYDGYTCVTTDFSLVVTADGHASKAIYYDQVKPTWCIWFTTNGSYVPAISGHAGDAVTAPTAPTRLGYTFAGWDTTGDGQVDALPTTMPAGNTEAVAVWTPAEVNYVVNYYKQNTDGSYSVADSTWKQGLTGSTTPTVKGTADAKDTSKTGSYAWYEYDYEVPVTIKADGTSVLKVYYKRVTVTAVVNLEMDDQSLVEYSRSDALYGVDSLAEWDAWLAAYRAKGGTKSSIFDLMGDSGTMKGSVYAALERQYYTTDFDTKTATFTVHFTSDKSYTFYYYFCFQALDGSYPDPTTPGQTDVMGWGGATLTMPSEANLFSGFTCINCRGSQDVSTGLFSSATWLDSAWRAADGTPDADGNYRVPVSGYTSDPSNLPHNAGEFKFQRNSFDTAYYYDRDENGNWVGATKTHLFEAPYSTSEMDMSTITPPAAGYTFAGWYDNEDFTGSPVTEATQPASTAVYYAKWVAPQVTVTFDSDGGSFVPVETFDKGAKATRPADPTRSGSVFDGWYYTGTDGVPVKWSFDQAVDEDITLVAAWTADPQSTTACKVIHQTKDGTVLATETINGDTGETVTAAALAKDDPRRAGYAYVDAGYRSLTLTGDEDKDVVTFTYTNDAAYEYTVRYVDRATGEALVADNVFGSDANLVALTALGIDGYTVEDPDGWVSADKTTHTFYYDKEAATPIPASPVTPTPASSVTSTTPTTQRLAQTGDATNAGVLVGVALCGVVSLALALDRRRRER